MVNLEYEAHKQAGRIINLNSPQQLAHVLYNELKLDAKYNLQVIIIFIYLT
jgi:DNA polymerase I - 3''-5'' exonuclease and polymerase domains